MADQDAQDINQMMSATSDVPIVKPKKSMFIWVVLGCVVVGVGLGIVVYQQSVKTISTPSPTPKTAVSTPKPSLAPSPLSSPVTPQVSLVEPETKTVAFPKAGKIRVYAWMGSYMPIGAILKDTTSHTFTVPTGTSTTPMKILDTGYNLAAAGNVEISSYLGANTTQLSIGWMKPVSNNCGANGFGLVDITSQLAWATEQAKGEPLVSVQCWGDYSPNPGDTSAKDFNDYVLIWSYTPSSGASASPSSAASSSPAASVSPSPSASAKASVSPSPSASAKASASPSVKASSTATPTPSARSTMPDTSEGTPVTGIFEVTVGTISVGLLLLVLGLFGLLAL